MGTNARDLGGKSPAGETLASFFDLDDLLCRVASYASESAGTEASCVLLHDADAHELVAAAVSGPTVSRMRGQRFPDTDGVAGAVLRSRQPCVVTEVGGRIDHPLSPVDHVAAATVHFLIAAPLQVENRTLGVVEAVNRRGRAFDPADIVTFVSCCNVIAVALENASLYRRLHTETEVLRRSRQDDARPLIAESPAMRHVIAQADRAAAGRSTILLVGDTGTGKEQVARRIHDASPRAKKAFVALNCGALPDTLIESELFGHEKGAFTGADRRHVGRFELAEGGTLFLDEIGDLPAAAQVKLLRVLQEHEITRVGGTDAVRVNVRVIAATHRDLLSEVRAGRFREDLYFRVHVVPISLPPLRDRPEDVLPLSLLFLDRYAREMGRAARTITPEAVERLRAHRWPGNVRELQNLMERLMVLGDDGPIHTRELEGLLPKDGGVTNRVNEDPDPGTPRTSDLSLWHQERSLLVHALERAGQNQTRAAAVLRISREQLRTRMKRYGLLPVRSRSSGS
jgi:transcriptional regulator with GAF, ATPase, and Fis domain